MWKYIIAVVIALIAGIGIGTQMTGDGSGTTAGSSEEAATYRCPMHPTVTDDHAGSCPICGMDLVPDRPAAATSGSSGERQVAYWRAPMDPSYTSPEPGKSPMGMDLVPVYEDELGQEGTVQIDPVTVQNIGVRTAIVERGQMSRQIRAVGRVDYDETLMTDVNTKVTGWVEKLHVDYTGESVELGQPLLEIYSPELVAAQEEYLTALDYHERLQTSAGSSVVRGAQDLVQASAQRLRYWDITDEQIAELKETRSVRRTMTVYSPQRGVVVHKAVFDGQHIGSGQHLYRIADLSRVWVYADVYENELPWVKQGQHAKVELSYLPGRSFHGQVAYIYPFLDPKTRTVQVRLAFDNADGALKPEMYADVLTESVLPEEAITIPVQAVIHTGSRRIAVVSLGEGRFQPREIQVGVESDGHYQVLSGVREGEEIVTSAQFLIDSESNLKSAVSAMRGSESGSVVIEATEDTEAMSAAEMGQKMSHDMPSHGEMSDAVTAPDNMSHDQMSHPDTTSMSPDATEHPEHEKQTDDHSQH